MHPALHVRLRAGARPGIFRLVAALVGLASIACSDAAVEPPTSTNSPTETDSPSPLTVSASATPWRVEDFTTYGGSTSKWKSDPHDWMYSASSWMHQERIVLDTKNLYNGHPTLRYDWPGPAAGSPWGGCNTDPAIQASYKAPSNREVWIEVAHKFRSDWYPLGPNCNAGGYKLLLLWRESDRFDIINFVNAKNWWSGSPQKAPYSGYSYCSTSGAGENCRWGYGKDQSQFLSSLPGMHWDSQWHIYRVHLRIPAVKGNTDGIYEIWIDGKKVLNRYNRTFIANNTGAFLNHITSIALGSNSNSGTRVATQTWWGHLKIWTSNPGW